MSLVAHNLPSNPRQLNYQRYRIANPSDNMEDICKYIFKKQLYFDFYLLEY